MDKSCQSSGDSTTTSSSSINNNNRDQYLKQLNKLSHKISKPIITKKPPFDQASTIFSHQPQPQPQQEATQQQQQQQQQQPPVYNISKNDFRDVVQKLTGSPAHERISTLPPPPIHPPKPPSSRLQRIRPPPLAHVSNRPPPLLNSTVPPQQPPVPLNTALNPVPTANSFIPRPPAPLSPLPPFPTVHAAAESPISAYMRHLQNSMSAVDPSKPFSGSSPLTPLVSPQWNNQQEWAAPKQSAMISPSQPPFQLGASPLPFGCLNSPRSPYPLLSPTLLFSPSSFPLSPTLPVPSPTWRGH